MSQNPVKPPTARFSADEDEILIEFVQKHSVLYDLKDPEFKNTFKKDMIWIEAGKTLNKEGSECKKRWKHMRDHYKREKKEERGSTGMVVKKKRAGYWKRLQFLDTVKDEISSFTDVRSPSNNEDSIPEEPSINELQHSGEDESPEQASERAEIVSSTPASGGQEAIFRASASKSTKERVGIQKVLQERTEVPLYFKRCLEDTVRQALPDENEIDLFFKTMAATVKKFRPDLATKAKASVFKIITDLEIVNQQLALPTPTWCKCKNKK